MPSSISSSDRRVGDTLPARAALAWLAMLVVTVAALVASVRPDARNPVERPWYFRMKLAWHDSASAVVAGNSQVYFSIDPAAFQQECPSLPLHNYGFPGALMRRQYVDSAVSVLSSRGPRVLLVGINPMQFKDEGERDGFTNALAHEASYKLPWQFERAISPLLASLRPLERPVAVGPQIRWDYRDNGYIATDLDSLHLKDGGKYERDYQARPFSERMYQAMLDQLRDFRARGYEVMLFETYSSPEFEAIDRRMTGLDASRLAADAASHGLAFLPLETAGLRSWDGIHLDSASAALFGRRLGRAVAAELGPRRCGAAQP